jgi:hypothetical protein
MSMNLLDGFETSCNGGPPTCVNSKTAGNFMSILDRIQQDKASKDPFMMLREALDVQTAAAGLPGRDVSDEASLRFQNY